MWTQPRSIILWFYYLVGLQLSLPRENVPFLVVDGFLVPATPSSMAAIRGVTCGGGLFHGVIRDSANILRLQPQPGRQGSSGSTEPEPSRQQQPQQPGGRQKQQQGGPRENPNPDGTSPRLSDVDARVLQSMLQDSKLDLRTEQDLRKLLERGTVKKQVNVQSTTSSSSDSTQEGSVYASQAIRTLADTKLWKKIRIQASDVMESLGIWLSNRAQQDVQILTALGFFAWERAVRDVSRALPEAGAGGGRSSAQSSRFLLTTNSSYSSSRDIREELNRPSDEIQSVAREIRDILSGQSIRMATKRTTMSRGSINVGGSSASRLRTAAPAGSVYASERQRRAYQQRVKQDQQERNVIRVAGSLVDTAYEVKRELQVESSRPGYKTETVRNAIEAGVVGTGNLLRSVQEQARWLAPRSQQQRLQAARSKQALAFSSDTIQKIRRDQAQLLMRLTKCVDEPQETWLHSSIFKFKESMPDLTLSVEVMKRIVALKEAVSKLELGAADSKDNVVDSEIITSCRLLRTDYDELVAYTRQSVSDAMADRLEKDILGENLTLPVILCPDELEPLLTVESPLSMDARAPEPGKGWSGAYQSMMNPRASGAKPPFGDDIVDVVLEVANPTPQDANVDEVLPDYVYFAVPTGTSKKPDDVYFSGTSRHAEVSDEVLDNIRNLVAEVVSDDAFRTAVGERQVSQAVAEETDKESETPSLAVTIMLRSLDIAFLVLEKVVIVGIPTTILIAETVKKRVDGVNLGGRGTQGWKKINRLADPKSRY